MSLKGVGEPQKVADEVHPMHAAWHLQRRALLIGERLKHHRIIDLIRFCGSPERREIFGETSVLGGDAEPSVKPKRTSTDAFLKLETAVVVHNSLNCK